MKHLFDTPQLKEGTYRAFIWEPGHVIIIFLIDNYEDAFKTSKREFNELEMNELTDYFTSFDTWGKEKNVKRMLDGGFEEVIV